mgnify:CR=1 FL=1
MINFFISFIMMAISFCNAFSVTTNHIEKFCLMNAGSFIDEFYRKTPARSNILYSMSFIQYPNDIKSHQVFIQKNYDSHIISSSLDVLNFGVLEDIDENTFSASDKKFELSIFNIESQSFIYGVSTGYVFSNIDSYSSTIVTYNIGFKKYLLQQRLSIGFSIENINKVIADYSNINESYISSKKITTELIPQYLKALIVFDYIHTDNSPSEYALGIKKYINKNINIFLGKYFFIDNKNEVMLFDNCAAGIDFSIKDYKINFGVQHLSSSIISFGTSLSVIK